jgi:hypothetical protein
LRKEIAVATIQSAEVLERCFARYANEHGMDAALERLIEMVAYGELLERTMEAVRSGRAEEFKERLAREQASAVTRARNKITVAYALTAPPPMTVAAARPPVAARERRERPRARRTVASRDGPDELDPPPPAPSFGGRS